MKIIQEGFYDKQLPDHWWVGRRCHCNCGCIFELEKNDELARVPRTTSISLHIFAAFCPKCRQPVEVRFDFESPNGNPLLPGGSR